MSKALACTDILKNSPELCQIQDEYQNLKGEFKDQYGVDIDFLNKYRSLRVIKKEHWKARSKDFRCQPWEFYEPKPKAWIRWEMGANRTEKLVKETKKQDALTIPKLDMNLMMDIHAHTIDMSMLGILPTLKGAGPGVIRESKIGMDPGFLDPGFTVKCDDQEIDTDTYKFMSDYDLKDENGNPLITVNLVRCDYGFGYVLGKKDAYYKGVIKYMSSKGVKAETERFIQETNSKFEDYQKSSKPNNNALDLIADMQRWFVSIHPFGDGNGRTSRFLQDYMTSFMGLPYLPSGSLQFDVFKKKEEYQKEVNAAMRETINDLNGCLNEYKTKRSLREISCDCRPMYHNINKQSSQVTKSLVKDNQMINCYENREKFKEVEKFGTDYFKILDWMVRENIYKQDDL